MRRKHLRLLPILACTFITVPSAFAQSVSAPFCERIETHEESVHADFDIAVTSRANLEKQEDESLVGNRQKQDEIFVNARLDTDAQFSVYIATLRQKAGKNTAKRAALDTFENTIIESRNVFRSAVVGIIEAFRQGMDEVIRIRRENFATIETTRRASFDEAVQAAKNTCSRGATGTETEETFKTTLRDIRETFRNELKQGETEVRVRHRTVIDARKDALAEARDARKQTVEAAAETLRVSWR